jgi:hypothetical protein
MNIYTTRNYGVYVRSSDLEIWHLDRITWFVNACTEKEVNAHFGLQTLIVGPLNFFPKFLET